MPSDSVDIAAPSRALSLCCGPTTDPIFHLSSMVESDCVCVCVYYVSASPTVREGTGRSPTGPGSLLTIPTYKSHGLDSVFLARSARFRV